MIDAYQYELERKLKALEASSLAGQFNSGKMREICELLLDIRVNTDAIRSVDALSHVHRVMTNVVRNIETWNRNEMKQFAFELLSRYRGKAIETGEIDGADTLQLSILADTLDLPEIQDEKKKIISIISERLNKEMSGMVPGQYDSSAHDLDEAVYVETVLRPAMNYWYYQRYLQEQRVGPELCLYEDRTDLQK